MGSFSQGGDPGFDRLQLAGDPLGEEAIAGFGDEDLVLDADAETPLGEVDARLHGDHGPHGEGEVVAPGVVDVEAHEMPEAVDERLEVSGPLEGRLRDLLQVR